MHRIEVTTTYEFKDQNLSLEEHISCYLFKIQVAVKCPPGIRNSKKTIKDLFKTSPEARTYFTSLCMRVLDRNISSYQESYSYAYPEISGGLLTLHLRIQKGTTTVNSIEYIIDNILKKKVNT